jgi:hypothetical protein
MAIDGLRSSKEHRARDGVQMEEQRKAFQSAAAEGLALAWPSPTAIPLAQLRSAVRIDAALPNQQRVTDAIAHWEAT